MPNVAFSCFYLDEDLPVLVTCEEIDAFALAEMKLLGDVVPSCFASFFDACLPELMFQPCASRCRAHDIALVEECASPFGEGEERDDQTHTHYPGDASATVRAPNTVRSRRNSRSGLADPPAPSSGT